jgi:subtilisin family serine protease
VAGTVASPVFGVAEGATVVPVRVLDCDGWGSTKSFLAGLDWVLRNHPAGTPGVINMSLGSEVPDYAIDEAVTRMHDRGFFVAAAAGNDSVDACDFSPARSAGAYTVGATDRQDWRAGFSNWGQCLDIFAPGDEIASLDMDDGYYNVQSGTSMATPHVAGAAAVYLGQHPKASPDQVRAALDSAATGGVINAISGSPNKILTMAASLTPGAPRDVAATSQAPSEVTVSWSPPSTGLVAPTSYDVVVRPRGGSWVLGGSTSRTSMTVTDGVPPTGPYEVRVTARVGQFAGQPSKVLSSDAFAPILVDRWAGMDRFEVAANISARNFDPGVPVVYIANGWASADALAAAPVAAAGQAPVLLTQPAAIPPSVLDELKRLAPERVVILGGTGSVSTKLENQLRSLR